MWLAQWLRDRRLESTDRVAHELRVLGETLQAAGSYDQLNLGGVAAFEIVARRVQLITEAYSNPQKPDWDTTKFFSGRGGAGQQKKTDSVVFFFRKNGGSRPL